MLCARPTSLFIRVLLLLHCVRVRDRATSIFSKNKYLVSFIERFHLAKAKDDGDKHVLGLWDGAAFRFRWPDSALLPARILARYGTSPLRLIEAVKSAVDHLLDVYDLQSQNVSFSSPEALFDALRLTNLTQASAADYFEKRLKVSHRFVDEFVTGASRDNYNQGKAINAFVDLVSLAGAGIGGSVFSLANGTTPLVAALLASGGASIRTHTSSQVQSIRTDGNQFELAVAGGASLTYDAVAVATPLEHAHGLSLSGAPPGLNTSRPYQRTCVTFVSGAVDRNYFGLSSDADGEVPTDILTVENASLPFSTLTVHATLPNGTHVYKLFSRVPLGEEVLSAIFRSRYKTVRLDWPAAYPKLEPTPPKTTWPPFEMPLSHSGTDSARPLIYVGAMESGVSCMETQLIAAKNAALRIARMLQPD